MPKLGDGQSVVGWNDNICYNQDEKNSLNKFKDILTVNHLKNVIQNY